MSFRSIFSIMAFSFILVACLPEQTLPTDAGSADSSPVSTPARNPSPTSETPPFTPSLLQATPGATLTPDYVPRPGDTTLSRAEIYLDSSSIVSQGSNPVQFFLSIKGNLPTPCNQLRVLVNAPDSQNRIMLEVYSVADPNRICAQILKPFEQMVLLGSLPGGHYTVYINGKLVSKFDA